MTELWTRSTLHVFERVAIERWRFARNARDALLGEETFPDASEPAVRIDRLVKAEARLEVEFRRRKLWVHRLAHAGSSPEPR